MTVPSTPNSRADGTPLMGHGLLNAGGLWGQAFSLPPRFCAASYAKLESRRPGEPLLARYKSSGQPESGAVQVIERFGGP